MLKSGADRAFVVQFAKQIELLADLTNSRPKLQAALKEVDTPSPQMRTGKRLKPVHRILGQRAPVIAAALLPFASANRTNLGSARGTVNTPSTTGPELRRFARNSIARQRARLSTLGNGCAGSMVIGVSSGSTSRWK